MVNAFFQDCRLLAVLIPFKRSSFLVPGKLFTRGIPSFKNYGNMKGLLNRQIEGDWPCLRVEATPVKIQGDRAHRERGGHSGRRGEYRGSAQGLDLERGQHWRMHFMRNDLAHAGETRRSTISAAIQTGRARLHRSSQVPVAICGQSIAGEVSQACLPDG